MLRVKDTTEFLEKLVLLLIEKLGKDSDSLTTIDNTIAAKYKSPDLLAKVIVKLGETMSPDDILKGTGGRVPVSRIIGVSNNQ